jgi:hypothetical protein
MRFISICAAGWLVASPALADADARFDIDRATLASRLHDAVGEQHPFQRADAADCHEDRLLRFCRVSMPGSLSLQIVEGPDGSAQGDAQDFFSGARASVRSVKAVFDGVGQDQHAAFTGLCAGIVDAIRGAPPPGALQAYVEARETAYSLASEGGLAEIVLRRGRARLVVEAHRGQSLSCEVKAI